MLDQTAPLFDLDLELRKEVVAIFLTESEAEMEILRASFEDKNWEQASASAHKLKGSGRMIGALGFSRIAESIEDTYNERARLTGDHLKQIILQYNLLTDHLKQSNPF